MGWDNTPAGAEYWTREVLRANLLGGGGIWATWQTAITAALGAANDYTLPTVPTTADIWIDGPPPEDATKDYPVISVDWVPPRVMGAQIGATNDWITTIQIQVKWWFCHDGVSSSSLFSKWEVAELVQDDLQQMILMALMQAAAGIVAIGTPKITAMTELDDLAQSPRKLSEDLYALVGWVTFEMTQDAQCR